MGFYSKGQKKVENGHEINYNCFCHISEKKNDNTKNEENVEFVDKLKG